MVPLLVSESRLHHGSEIVLNGTTYRLNFLTGDDTRLHVPSRNGESVHGEALRFDQALRGLHELAQRITLLNERLLDPLDGLTNRCVQTILTVPEVSASFKERLAPWAFALFKHGSNVHGERGCVLVPPASREQFEKQIQGLSARQRGQYRWRDFLDHIYDATPLVTQGFYLFDRPEDRLRFEEALGSEYALIRKKLHRIFNDALGNDGAIPARQWKRFDELSQQALSMQQTFLEPALSAAEGEVRAIATRVRIRCYEGGELRFLVRPYSFEFAEQFDEMAELLERVRMQVPPHAIELREVLADLSDWCRARTTDESWAECLPSWIAASDPTNLIDVNLTVEEKVSRLGAKGGIQLVVSAFETVPEPLRPIVSMLNDSNQGANLNVVWLKHLLVGGGASNMTMAGEKLPDSEGRDCYKVMTFTNAVRSSMVESQAELMVASTHFSEDDIPRLAHAANLLVLLHEVGHTFGDFAEFLGEYGASVEETHAEASVIFLAHRWAPQSLVDLIGLTACWTPVHRCLQGAAEAHSHSDIVLFDEILRAGGVACVERDGRPIVAPMSADEAVRAAFDLSLRMRLWELGIPSGEHGTWWVRFDPNDPALDVRVIQRARKAVELLGQEQRRAWQTQVFEECKVFFAQSRLEELSRPLQPIIERLPRYQPLSIIPTDERFRLVASFV
ncbi:MAG TPA: hypothetical protein PK710_17215 [Polyangiaceae bacterium]|nr:hypothetical protein [Polyangiaceae bacterium]